MEDKFVVVVHYMGGFFNQFTHNGYEGSETSWLCDPDVWSYFEILGNLEVMCFTKFDTMWYYDPYLAPEMHLLENDNDISRIKFLAESDGKAHIYVIHQVP
jgi:hypothetical protein